jgi:DNA invertase Pin-like site-specific DNA recombinase
MNALDALQRTGRTPAEEPPATEFTGRSGTVRSPKILEGHLERLAVIYVRQSDPQQVLNHRESRERQYALADHAVVLGWPRDRVLIIDEDQGQSAKTPDRRSGFQHLLAEVTMEHVGLVLGIEMSQITRNNKDWHNLLEMCAIFGTILADEDRVYDPNDPSDRLLLGLSGLMSEYELITMRNRMERGRLHKAQRGELFHRAPTGYIKLSTERVELDPDEQVREVIRLIFDKYDEIGSVWGVFRYLIRNNIRTAKQRAEAAAGLSGVVGDGGCRHRSAEEPGRPIRAAGIVRRCAATDGGNS